VLKHSKKLSSHFLFLIPIKTIYGKNGNGKKGNGNLGHGKMGNENLDNHLGKMGNGK